MDREACRPVEVLPREAPHPCPYQEGVCSPRGWSALGAVPGSPDPPNVRQMSELKRFWKVICTELLIWQMRKLWPERERAGASKLIRGRTRYNLQLLHTLHPVLLSLCSEGLRGTSAALWVCRVNLPPVAGMSGTREVSPLFQHLAKASNSTS